MTTDPRATLLLALADDELVQGHRLSEWTGWVPYVEEDLALSSIAQDEIGHARALYDAAAELTGGDADALAFGRAPDEYRHAVLLERANRDYAFTLARHYCYDTADDVRLEALAGSSFTPLAALARVFRAEEAFHLEHARTWLRRLATGSAEARARVADALAEVLAEAPGLFEPVPGEDALVADATLPVASASLYQTWLGRLREDLAVVDLDRLLDAPALEIDFVPTSSGEAATRAIGGETDGDGTRRGAGGRAGRHTPEFLGLWEEMTGLYRAHPGARW